MAYSFNIYLPYYKRNLKVAIPVILTQIGSALVGFFDSVMVGHYGTTDLAAVSFSNAIFFTIMVLAMGAIMGLTPLVGHEVGSLSNETNEEAIERKHLHISSLLANGGIFTLILCALTLALLAPCIPFLGYFGQDVEVVSCARPYFTLIVLSIIPFNFFCLSKQFLEGLGNTTVAMIITLVCNLLNIGLNWIFIFGHWGCPAMGATGAGLATLIARIVMPICFFIVIWYKKEWRMYLTSIHKQMLSWQEQKKLFRLGLPIGLQTFAETFLFTASFIIVGWISKEALAAHQVANQMADITFMLVLGIGSATTIRVSHQLGEGNIHGVRMASNASIHLCLLINIIGAIVMIGGRMWIPYVFTEDPKVVEIASTLLIFAGLLQFADGLQCVGAAMLRGIQDVKVPMKIALCSYIGITLPLGLILTFPLGLGAKGMWIAFVIALAIPAVLFHIRFRKQLSKRSAISRKGPYHSAKWTGS
jgi:MATE family multidrug resistance protein